MKSWWRQNVCTLILWALCKCSNIHLQVLVNVNRLKWCVWITDMNSPQGSYIWSSKNPGRSWRKQFFWKVVKVHGKWREIKSKVIETLRNQSWVWLSVAAFQFELAKGVTYSHTPWMSQPIPKWFLSSLGTRNKWVMEIHGIWFSNFYGNPVNASTYTI